MKVIRLTAGTPRFEWCDDCLTNAVVSFDIWALQADGLHLFGSYRACDRCKEKDQ